MHWSENIEAVLEKYFPRFFAILFIILFPVGSLNRFLFYIWISLHVVDCFCLSFLSKALRCSIELLKFSKGVFKWDSLWIWFRISSTPFLFDDVFKFIRFRTYLQLKRELVRKYGFIYGYFFKEILESKCCFWNTNTNDKLEIGTLR